MPVRFTHRGRPRRGRRLRRMLAAVIAGQLAGMAEADLTERQLGAARERRDVRIP